MVISGSETESNYRVRYYQGINSNTKIERANGPMYIFRINIFNDSSFEIMGGTGDNTNSSSATKALNIAETSFNPQATATMTENVDGPFNYANLPTLIAFSDKQAFIYNAINGMAQSTYYIGNYYKEQYPTDGTGNMNSAFIGIITNESGDITGNFSGDIDNSNIVDSINSTIESTILGELDEETGERKGGLLGGILDGIKGLFIPDDDYFYNEDEENPGLWQRFNSFFSAKLGFLWDMIVFVPNLISSIISLLSNMTEDWSITVPSIDVPDFQGGEVTVLESFDWSPYTIIHENETIAYVYDLYLDIIDFFVYFGLVWYGVRVYNEVLGNSNTEVE